MTPDGRSTRPRRRFLAGSLGAAAGLAAIPRRSVRADDSAAAVLIDSHVHFYDPGRPEGVPWPAKDDKVLYRPVFPDEWEKLVAAYGPAGAIVVEASPWVEDNQWVLDLADRHATSRGPGSLGIVGVVGNLPLGDDACGRLIDRFAAHRLFKGIRTNGDALLAGLASPAHAGHVAQLAERGLALDLNGGSVFAAALAVTERFPDLRVVIDHLANTRVTPDGPLAGWRDDVARVADRPGVFMKVSGVAESAFFAMKPARAPVDPRFYEPWFAAVWKAFGGRRLMYGSNWPVSDLAATYADVHGIVAPFVRGQGPDAERWFFSETSRAAYRWT
jgi:predicted TIM-barrel fold metal-dependent hydrolase